MAIASSCVFPQEVTPVVMHLETQTFRFMPSDVYGLKHVFSCNIDRISKKNAFRKFLYSMLLNAIISRYFCAIYGGNP
jgi:hypothetical protein